MFTTALFTISNSWKQPKCSPTDEWIKNLLYIYPHMQWNATQQKKKKNAIYPFAATWMDLEGITLKVK